MVIDETTTGANSVQRWRGFNYGYNLEHNQDQLNLSKLMQAVKYLYVGISF